MTVKLDPPKVKHSRASDDNDRIWFYEELEGEILDFAKYMKKHYDIKYTDTAMAHLKRIGASINNLKMVSGLGFGDVMGIYDYSAPNPNKPKPMTFMTKEDNEHYKSYTVEERKKQYPKQTKIHQPQGCDAKNVCRLVRAMATLFLPSHAFPCFLAKLCSPLGGNSGTRASKA